MEREQGRKAQLSNITAAKVSHRFLIEEQNFSFFSIFYYMKQIAFKKDDVPYMMNDTKPFFEQYLNLSIILYSSFF